MPPASAEAQKSMRTTNTRMMSITTRSRRAKTRPMPTTRRISSTPEAKAIRRLAVVSDEHARAPDGDDDHDDEDDGEDAEEEVVESVGGDDVLEEVPERAFRPRRQYKIQEVIKRRQVMLVQVVKEERGNKGAALTTYLSLAGRYAVLMPNTARGGGISRKITSAQDRSRLKEVVQDLDVPEGMGIILRTAGASRTKPEIKRDFEYLIRMWETVRDMTLKSQAPTLVYEEGSLIKRSLRDLYNKEIDEIQVAGEAGYQEARDFMKMLMPSNVRAVKQYRDGQPLFSRMGVESQLDAMFSPTVQLRSGGYIVINQTEALVSIDVNSGRSTREHHIEDTALKTNLEASEEVARQLRLRDLAGLIVIDFIDMDEKRNNRAVERKLSDCLRQDRARIQVGRISHFGLLEMSRQRIRASVLESSTEPCAHMRRQRSRALGLVGGAAIAARHRGNPDEGRDPQSGGAHPHRRRALRASTTSAAICAISKTAFKVSLAVSADPTVSGQQSFIIDRGEQVHTLEAAKALLAAQAAAFPPQVEEAYDDDEAFDVETESEVETEETEGLTDDAAEATAAKAKQTATAASGADAGAAVRRGRVTAPPRARTVTRRRVAGEARRRRRDRRGRRSRRGRRRRTARRGPRRSGRPMASGARAAVAVAADAAGVAGLEDGLAGSIADELGPTPASEVTSAVADFDGGASEPAPSLVQADVHARTGLAAAGDAAAAYARPEPVESAPRPAAEETGQEAERAARGGVRPCARKSASRPARRPNRRPPSATARRSRSASARACSEPSRRRPQRSDARPARRAGGRGASAAASKRSNQNRKPPGQNRAVFSTLRSRPARSSRSYPVVMRRLHVGRIDLLVEVGLQLVVIELAFPPRHHHAGDAVAAEIGQRAALAHELVDAENDRHARHQPRIDHGERRGQRDEARAGDAATRPSRSASRPAGWSAAGRT